MTGNLTIRSGHVETSKTEPTALEVGGELWECGMRAQEGNEAAGRGDTRVLPLQHRWSSRKRLGIAISTRRAWVSEKSMSPRCAVAEGSGGGAGIGVRGEMRAAAAERRVGRLESAGGGGTAMRRRGCDVRKGGESVEGEDDSWWRGFEQNSGLRRVGVKAAETGEWEGAAAGGGVGAGDRLEGVEDGMVGTHGKEAERERVEVVVTPSA
ncbi:hypothetical protein R3P38DRAFT_3599028 [Favolaschia claudopus]|uniref:Uncharacterized protein n=1 Tax=Favolaschia claudopus TaxID=2862362 RepID=A0AAW0ADE3_9AGAR